jgi:PKD domain
MNVKKKLLIATIALFLITVYGTTASAQTTPDPGLMGSHTVLKLEYNFGDTSYTPPAAAGFPSKMEEIGSVHYPADLSSGPFPVIVFLHGRHSTCYDTSDLSNSSSDWPCLTGWAPITSYEGYDYVATTMASHGYIVISVSCNSINAIDATLSDAGMNARGVLVQHHLDLWNGWNTTDTTGPFGSMFVGKLNMQNVGTMGHSRGGEGVIFNAEYNRSLGSPYGINAVLTLAPVDFYRHVLNGIPLMDIAPYCDGDVSDLEGVHFFDDARYIDTTDETPKHMVLFMGANHDFFNTVWTPGSYIAGGADDWADYGYNPLDPHCGTSAPSRFDTTKQKAALNAYLPAFFRTYIGKEVQFTPILEVNDIVPPASSTLDSEDVFVSYHAGKYDRLDINRTDSLTRYNHNTLGDTVIEAGLASSAICGGGVGMPVCDGGLAGDQLPHRGTASLAGLGQMRTRWSDTTAFYENDIPAAFQNTTLYQSLMFRTSVDFKETTGYPDLDFSVVLIDSTGDSATQVMSTLTHALFLQQGTESGELPKEVFNTINVPLSGFTGINRAKVRKVKFKFNRPVTGAVMVSDIAFTSPLCGNLSSAFTDSITHVGYNVVFTNKATHNAVTDTFSYVWNFGEPSSGTRDTSTRLNPTHAYSAAGTYTACLYVISRRTNGLTCTDTFCQTITVPHNVGVNTVTLPIIPNPARDHIQVNGAANTDVLTLTDLYGRTVLTATLSSSSISLPDNIAPGVYCAIVTTASGKIYQKLVITR